MQQWLLAVIGPGMAMAATGVGASDFVTAAVNGGKFGLGLLWIILAGAAIKLLLNEGLARWQLATDSTLLEGWCRHFPPFVRYLFVAYLAVWTFFLSASLGAACGLAGHSMFPLPCDPKWSVALWGTWHLVAGYALVRSSRYRFFEILMTILVGLMFIGTVAGALLARPDWSMVLNGLIPRGIPDGSAPYILGTIGGVGGSVTILSYGYWLIQAQRTGRTWIAATRFDLAICYTLTALFGMGVMIIASQVLYPAPNIVEDRSLIVQLANTLREHIGPAGYWLYMLSFWGAVFSTVIGCMNGIPYLFSHLVAMIRQVPEARHAEYTSPQSKWYHRYLLFMTFPPMIMLYFKRPVAMVVTFAILASFVTPFITATLLYLNNKRELGRTRNTALINALLIASLGLFVYLAGTEIRDQLQQLFASTG